MEERGTKQRGDEMEYQIILEEVKNMKLDEGEGEGEGKGGGEHHHVRNQNQSLSLLGFYYNMNYDRIQFAPIPSVATTFSSSPFPHYSTEFVSTGSHHISCRKELGDSVVAVLNSSNGLILLYLSTFLKLGYSKFLVQNPITQDSFQLPSPPYAATPNFPQNGINNNKRFIVYGFAFEPFAAPHPNFTVVELTDVLLPSSAGGGGLLVNSYSSLHGRWKSRVHHDNDDIAPWLGNKYVLFGPSTFHNGALHWLLDPSGVIAYNLQSETFSFSLTNIPGDREYADEFGFCNCSREAMVLDSALIGTPKSWCNCRYLGESRDQLIYARVTDHSEFSLWILEDYSSGAWSNRRRVVVDNLRSTSLFHGRVLAFDRKFDVVFLKVKSKIFSYNYISKELKVVCKVNRCYVSDDNCDCDGFILPYEVPSPDPPFIPNNISVATGTNYGDMPKSNSTTKINLDQPNASPIRLYYPYAITQMAGINLDQPNASPIRLYHHYAITQMAGNFFPHLQLHGTKTTQPPFRTPVDLCLPVPASKAAVMDATVRYCDLVRVEACLYGCIHGRNLEGTAFDDIDLSKGEFAEYDEEGECPVMISDLCATSNVVK